MAMIELPEQPGPAESGRIVIRIVADVVSLPHQAADLKREILEAMQCEACSRVVLDCSRVRHLSTDGLAVILAIQKRLTERGGEVRLCHVDPEVEQSLRLCMLHKIVRIDRTLSDALG